MNVLILYHSGAGSTKLLSEIIFEKLKKYFSVKISHINNEYSNKMLEKFDLIIFGFPTHHAEPSLSIKEFINNLKPFNNPKKSLIFTTYGLYTGNSLRIFAKLLNKKNIEVLYFDRFRSPASDGVLLFSEKFKFMFKFENELSRKLDVFAENAVNYMSITSNKIPNYKWYVPFNELIKPFGIKKYNTFKKNMHIITKKCSNCNLCVNICERNAWVEDKIKPTFEIGNCEFCLECVHKCPTQTIIFSNRMKNKPRLNKGFFNKKKKEITNAQQKI